MNKYNISHKYHPLIGFTDECCLGFFKTQKNTCLFCRTKENCVTFHSTGCLTRIRKTYYCKPHESCVAYILIYIP